MQRLVALVPCLVFCVACVGPCADRPRCLRDDDCISGFGCVKGRPDSAEGTCQPAPSGTSSSGGHNSSSSDNGSSSRGVSSSNAPAGACVVDWDWDGGIAPLSTALFRTNHDGTGPARELPALPGNRRGAASAVVQGHLWIIGGHENNGTLSARVQPDGIFSGFTDRTNVKYGPGSVMAAATEDTVWIASGDEEDAGRVVGYQVTATGDVTTRETVLRERRVAAGVATDGTRLTVVSGFTYDTPPPVITSAETFDVTVAPPVPLDAGFPGTAEARAGMAMYMRADGVPVVVGGLLGALPSEQTVALLPDGMREAMAPTRFLHAFAAMAPVPDGLFLMGGVGVHPLVAGQASRKTERWSPVDGGTPGPDLNTNRGMAMGASSQAGIWVFGGCDPGQQDVCAGSSTRTTEWYPFPSLVVGPSSTPRGQLVEARSEGFYFYLREYLVVGGGAAGWDYASTTTNGPGTFESVGGEDARVVAGACLFQRDNNVWVIGGRDALGDYLPDVVRYQFTESGMPGIELIEPDTRWTLTRPRAFHTCVVHSDAVWVVGGRNSDGAIDDAERLFFSERDGGVFTEGYAAYLTARYGHVAYLQGDRLSLVGGYNFDNTPMTSIEVLQLGEQQGDSLGTVKFGCADTTPFWRGFGSSVTAGNRFILLGGEAVGGPPSSAVVFTMGPGGIESVATMPVALNHERVSPMVMRVHNQVCVVGGRNTAALDTSECIPLVAP